MRLTQAVTLAVTLAIAFCAVPLLGQTAPATNATPSQPGTKAGANPPPPPLAPGVVTTRPPALSSNEFMLSVMVLILGLVALALAFLLLRSRQISADDMIRLMSVILIIVGTLFLITAGFSSDQIAPAMGLFGTI